MLKWPIKAREISPGNLGLSKHLSKPNSDHANGIVLDIPEHLIVLGDSFELAVLAMTELPSLVRAQQHLASHEV